jgi:hypothetical protein
MSGSIVAVSSGFLPPVAQVPEARDEHFTERMECAQVGLGFDRAVRAGRPVGGDALSRKHQFYAVKVKTVTDSNAGVGVACFEQACYSFNALPSCLAPSFGDNLPLCHALLDEVVPANAGLGEMRVTTTASCGYHGPRQSAFFQVEGVVQARFEDRRRYAVVLRSPEDYNCVGGSGLIADGLSADGAIEQPLRDDDAQREGQQEEEYNPTANAKTAQPKNSFN